MLNIYLLRHGETAWNADGNRYCGRTDLPLTEKGVAQAEATRRYLEDIPFDAIYASPLQRALRTARIASGNKDVTADGRLIEVDFGSWEGKTKEEFVAENRSLWDSWLACPEKTKAGGTGETASEVIGRLNNFYNFVSAKHPDGNVLIVGHNGVNRLYLSSKLGMPLKNYRRFFLDNAAVTMFTLDSNGEILLKCLNGRAL